MSITAGVLVLVGPRERRAHLQRSTINVQKSVCQNLIMGQSYEPHRIFCRPLLVWILQIWPYPRHNPMVVALGAGLASMPMGAQA